MTRLGPWLGMGMTLLGVQDMTAAPTVHATDDVDVQQQPFLGGVLQQSRILYPLVVGEWSAADEHLYEDQAYGVSIRYAHGQDLDRWIDLYFYPAGPMSSAEFSETADSEADGIREAHREAGNAVDMGVLQFFSPNAGASKPVEGVAMDMGFTCDDIAYSSAMTLTLDRLYFVKARYSIEECRLSRLETLQQLQAFVTALQPRLTLLNAGRGAAAARGADSDAGDSPTPDGLREIRLHYCVVPDDEQPTWPVGVRTMVA